MTRLQADLTLVVVGLIWGFGFVAQKEGLQHLGPFTLVAVRFFISAIVVLPVVYYERGFSKIIPTLQTARDCHALIGLCLLFSAAVLFQQLGMTSTSVIHTSFITGLYVVLVPFACLVLERKRVPYVTLVACFLSIFGIWLLSGMDGTDAMTNFASGDILVFFCACCFALQLVLLGKLANKSKAPFMLSFLQYASVSGISFGLAWKFETIHLTALLDCIKPLLYAGILAGGVAYTLQAIAQQHTPATDTAIILSTEALFGGLGGFWFLAEKISVAGLLGCGAILAAIGLVEGRQLYQSKKRRFPSTARPH